MKKPCIFEGGLTSHGIDALVLVGASLTAFAIHDPGTTSSITSFNNNKITSFAPTSTSSNTNEVIVAVLNPPHHFQAYRINSKTRELLDSIRLPSSSRSLQTNSTDDPNSSIVSTTSIFPDLNYMLIGWNDSHIDVINLKLRERQHVLENPNIETSAKHPLTTVCMFPANLIKVHTPDDHHIVVSGNAAGERAKRASLEEYEHTLDESREMATDGYLHY